MAQYDLTTAGSQLEFDTQNNLYNACCNIDENHFVNFWQGVDGDGFGQMFEINTSTFAISTVGASYEFDSDNAAYLSLVAIDSSHVLAFWDNNVALAGYAQAFIASTSAGVGGVGGSAKLEVDSDRGKYSTMCQIDTNHFIAFYQGASTTIGRARTLTVSTSTFIVTNAAAAFAFDATDATSNSCCKLDDNHVVNFWAESNKAKAQVFEINTSTWAISTAGAQLNNYSTQQAAYGGTCFQVDENHFLHAWSGDGNDGFAQVFEVNTSTWAISTAGAAFEFDTQIAIEPAAQKIDANHFILFWRGGASSHGLSRTFEINTSTWAISEKSSLLSFYTESSTRYNCCVRLDTANYVNFWQGLGVDGFAQAFSVEVGTLYTKILTEVATIVGSVAPQANKKLTEAVVIADVNNYDRSAAFSDAIVVEDSIQKSPIKEIPETIGISAGMETASVFLHECLEASVIVDTFSTASIPTHVMTESVSINDIREMFLSGRELAESATTTDAISTERSRVLSDAIVITGAVESGFYVEFPESVSVSDISEQERQLILNEIISVQDTGSFLNTLINLETVTLSEDLQSIKDGITVGVWARTPTTEGVWTRKSYPL